MVSATTGKTLGEAHWPAFSRWSEIASVTDAGFTELSGDRLTLVAPDLATTSVLQLPSPPPQTQYPNIERRYLPRASPDGKRLLLLTDLTAKGSWLWIDAESLKLIGTVEGIQPWDSVCVSDDQIWAQRFAPRGPLETRTLSSAWHLFAVPYATENLTGCLASVGPGMLLYGANRSNSPHEPIHLGEFIASEDGRSVWPVTTHGREGTPLGAATACGGSRFVILTGAMVGGIGWLDVDPHSVLRGLLVYDAPFGPEPHRLLVGGSKAENVYSQALSPDGRRLALLGKNGLIEIFDLPSIGGWHAGAAK